MMFLWPLVSLLLVTMLGDSEAESQVGGGEQYLKRTEDRGDGKTAWFTGSSEFIPNVSTILTRICQAVNVMDGPPGVSSMRNYTDKLGMGSSVLSVEETGKRCHCITFIIYLGSQRRGSV